jgi:hypothetical protein
LLALTVSSIEDAKLPANAGVDFKIRGKFIPGCCPLFRDVVHHSAQSEKVDNFRLESLDNFDRNRWTTWNGMGGQLRPENAASSKQAPSLRKYFGSISLSGN